MVATIQGHRLDLCSLLRMEPAEARAILCAEADLLDPDHSALGAYLRRSLDLLASARKHDFAAIAGRLQAALTGDDDLLPTRLENLRDDLAGLLPTGRTASEAAWLRILGGALANGLTHDSASPLVAAEGNPAKAGSTNFPAPIRFEEAMRIAQDRELIATGLSSMQLRDLGVDLLQGAVFSARTTDARYVQAIKDWTEALIEGNANLATARMALESMLDQLGYTPEHGFPGDRQKGVPPAERGSLRDLGSETRINLVLNTQVRMMLGAGFRIAGQQPDRLWQYPCWELVRVASRRVPRGSAESHTEGWPARWRACGGEIVGGRMIARKDDPIWDRLGDPSIFSDGLGNPYPPFAFNSGYGVREESRTESEHLGILDPATAVSAMPVDLLQHFREEAENFDPQVLDELTKEAQIVVTEYQGQSTLALELAKRRAAYGAHPAGGAQ